MNTLERLKLEALQKHKTPTTPIKPAHIKTDTEHTKWLAKELKMPVEPITTKYNPPKPDPVYAEHETSEECFRFTRYKREIRELQEYLKESEVTEVLFDAIHDFYTRTVK